MSRAAVAALAAALGMANVAVPRAAAGPLSEGLPVRSPTAVGMSAERLAAVDRVVLSGIAAGGFPGAAVVVGRDGYAVVKRGYGRLTWQPDAPAVSDQSVYDLASLTKVVATTSAIMVLYDDGEVDLDAPVSRYLPEFTGGNRERVTIRHLLTHRSGLPAGRDLWRSASSPAEARRQVLETPLYCAPGACFEYSDLGADLLGFVAEAVSGQPLDRFVAENVFEPLGMTDTGFRPPASQRARTAPTEVAPPRGYPLRGEVHDENAYALGGVAGHAGLFSTAADLSIFAQALLNGGEYRGERVFADSTVRLFTRRAGYGGPGSSRGLGWDTCNPGPGGGGSCGRLMGPTSFGHTGFTGTSLWLDPERRMFVVLLTNRVYEARAARPARVIGDVRADLADAAELAVVDDPAGPRAMPAAFRADAEAGWHRAPVEAEERTTPRRASAAARAVSRRRSRASKSAKARAARTTSSKRATSSRSAKGGSSKSASTRGSRTSAGRSTAKSGSKSTATKSTGRNGAKASTKSGVKGKKRG